jgi:hypothetical protein
MKMTREKTIPFLFLALSVIAAYSFGRQEAKALFEQPALITSAGQSADGLQASVLAKKAELKADLAKFAANKDLENHKTLILVLGASMKGLGAAGLDTDKEKERITQLLAEAKKRNLPVLCLHIGGETRRGQLTDEMIGEYLPAAQMAIVVKSGNKDGIFTKICTAKNIPLIEVDKILDVVVPLKASFKR